MSLAARPLRASLGNSRVVDSQPVLLSRIHCRHVSGSGGAQEEVENKSQDAIVQTVKTPLDATARTSQPIVADVPVASTLNPPATTRPPPLVLPTRAPDASLFSHLFQLGKAYAGFYKSGVKAVFINYRLLGQVSSTLAAPPGISNADPKVSPTRAAILLRERTMHDMARLPIFGLLVMICGEITPLIVVVFPKLTPYTCRIPKQIQNLRRMTEERRNASLRQIRPLAGSAALEKAAPGHIIRSLGLGSRLWDRAGIDPPFAAARAAKVVERIAKDDAMIRDGGGVHALEPEEVVLACEDRAMDVRNADPEVLRERLGAWVRATARAEGEGEVTVRKLLIGLANEGN
jgi:hypothetical protein